jgi:hypothetical protein
MALRSERHPPLDAGVAEPVQERLGMKQQIRAIFAP